MVGRDKLLDVYLILRIFFLMHCKFTNYFFNFVPVGQPVSSYDVAVNSTFFNKVQTNKLFLSFFMTVVLEGIQDKYNLELDVSSKKPSVIVILYFCSCFN